MDKSSVALECQEAFSFLLEPVLLLPLCLFIFDFPLVLIVPAGFSFFDYNERTTFIRFYYLSLYHFEAKLRCIIASLVISSAYD